MLEITHDTTCHGSIISIGASEKYLFVLDNTYHLTLLHPNTLASLKSILLASKSAPLHQFSNAMDADDRHHILFTVAKSGKVIHMKITTKLEKITDTLWHEANIGCMTFDPTGRYYATGGNDGKVHLFAYESSKWLTSFEIRPDYISDLNFSHDGNYLLSAAYDHHVFLYDTVRIEPAGKFETSSVTESALFFDHNHKVCCITRHKTLEVYDRAEHEIIFCETLFDAWPTVIITDENERYIIVGTKQNLLYIISLDTYSVVAKVPLDVQGVSTLKLTDDALFIGTIDGRIMRVDRTVLLTEFETALHVKDYKKATELLEKNALLYFSKEAEVFDKDWPEVMTQARKLLELKKIDAAVALTDPFTKHNPKYSQEFLSYFSNSKEIVNLGEYVEKKLFQAAYELIEQFPTFKQLQLYQKLEEYWFLSFKKARRHLATGEYEGKLEAEKILHPFINVPQKEQSIRQLLASASVFENAEKLIKQKEFAAYFQMVEQFSFLESTELYLKTLALGSTLHDKVVRLEQEKLWDKAIELLEFLAAFPTYKKSSIERIKEINRYLQFIENLEEKNYKAAYAQAEESPYIQSSDEFQNLIKEFNTEYEEAYHLAKFGPPKKVLAALEIYFEIPYWNEKTKNIMKVAYANEIKNSALSTIDCKKTLENYIGLFGKDTVLEQAIHDISDFPKEVWSSVEENKNPKEKIELTNYFDTILA